MSNQYTLYWKWETVRDNMDEPLQTCRHAHSNQLGKVAKGDTLWIVTVAPESAGEIAGHLHLAARLQVGFCTSDLKEAVRRLGTDNFWEANWHVGAAKSMAEPYALVDISSVASELRFASQLDRLTIIGGKVNPQQFQSMRLLTEASAQRLQTLWEEGRRRDDNYWFGDKFSGPPMMQVRDSKYAPHLLRQEIDNDDLQYPEGRPILVEHLKHERNKALVKAAKLAFWKKHGRLFCEACDFDFSAVYGNLGYGYIEAHHTIPVSRLQPGATTHVEDLAMVCANCHRMLHASDPLLSVADLRRLLEQVRTESD